MEVSGSAFIPPTSLCRQDGERATSGASCSQRLQKMARVSSTLGEIKMAENLITRTATRWCHHEMAVTFGDLPCLQRLNCQYEAPKRKEKLVDCIDNLSHKLT
ncbi:hypothetical protein TNCV_754021 [Trichonephila clavipes]|nr:hypothetical protein TNCV_754021 [Trichonephila clavipes]